MIKYYKFINMNNPCHGIIDSNVVPGQIITRLAPELNRMKYTFAPTEWDPRKYIHFCDSALETLMWGYYPESFTSGIKYFEVVPMAPVFRSYDDGLGLNQCGATSVRIARPVSRAQLHALARDELSQDIPRRRFAHIDIDWINEVLSQKSR